MARSLRTTKASEVAAAAALVVAVAVRFVGGQYDVEPPGVLYEFWYSAASVIMLLGLTVLIAAYVGEWWMLAVALVPLAAAVPLEAVGHVAPWHDPLPPLEAAVLSTLFLVPVLALGVGVGRLVRRSLSDR